MDKWYTYVMSAYEIIEHKGRPALHLRTATRAGLVSGAIEGMFALTSPTMKDESAPATEPIRLISDDCWDRFTVRKGRYERNRARLTGAHVTREDGVRAPAREVLRSPRISLQSLVDAAEISLEIDPRCAGLDIASVETEVKYEGYLRRETARADRHRQAETCIIPPDFQFAAIPGLSREVVERLTSVRPDTIGQAGRVPGVTPAALAVLNAYVTRHLQRPAASSGRPMVR